MATTCMLASRIRCSNRIGIQALAWRHHEMPVQRNALSLWSHHQLPTAQQSCINTARRHFARNRGPSSIDVDFYDSAARSPKEERNRNVRSRREGKSDKERQARGRPKERGRRDVQRGERKPFDSSRGEGQRRWKISEEEFKKRQQRKDLKKFKRTLKGVQEEDDETDETPKRLFRADWMERKKNPDLAIKEKKQKQVPRVEREPRKKKKLEEESITHFPPFRCDVFVSCLPGLEPILAQEMKELGIKCKVEAGGVSPRSSLTMEKLHECHLQLGTATHILLRCGKPFTARGLSELSRKVSKQPWNKFINTSLPVQMRITSKKSKLNHNTAIRHAILEGINASFQSEKGNENEVYHAKEHDENPFRMVVRIDHDQVQISIDTWESPMHKRGYRLETAKAPLREDLAFAMVYGAGWRMNDPSSDAPYIKGLLDPFCGSGTIAIEAAAIAAGLPPGRFKGAPLEGTIWFRPKQWKQRLDKLLSEATSEEGERKVLQIAASDRDKGAIEAAKANADRAGVEGWIDFQAVALSSQQWLEPKNDDPPADCYPCLVATNPPWGLRIAADKTNKHKRRKKNKVHPLLPLYQTLISRQNSLNEQGCRVMSVTLLQDPNLFRKTGADLRVMWSSQHGGIPVAALFAGVPVESNNVDAEDGLDPKKASEKKQLVAEANN